MGTRAPLQIWARKRSGDHPLVLNFFDIWTRLKEFFLFFNGNKIEYTFFNFAPTHGWRSDPLLHTSACTARDI